MSALPNTHCSKIGIDSEGSFGPDPYAGFFTWNTEILLRIDDELSIEVTGIASGPAQSIHREVKTVKELLNFAIEAKFPEHHLVLRPEHQGHQQNYYGALQACPSSDSSNSCIF